MDAVGADQQIGPVRRQFLAGGPVDEMGLNAIRVLDEMREAMTGEDAFAADPRPHRIVKDEMQVAAVDRVLRPAVAGGDSSRLGPDQLAELVVIGEGGGLDGDLGKLVAKAELDQLADGVRLQIDADAERLDRRNLLEDRHVDARRMQAQRRGEAADTAPDHQNFHRSPQSKNQVERARLRAWAFEGLSAAYPESSAERCVRGR